MRDEQPTDLITTAEARKLLGVSPVKMAELIRNGYLRYFPYPLDKRVKLISKAEALSLRLKDRAA